MYRGGAACGDSCQQNDSSQIIVVITYAEILDLVENLIVESKVVAWNDINTGILLDVPVLET